MIRKRILIADDEELIRSIVRTALGDGYEISEAADGEETWQKLTMGQPDLDLVILDWNMPRLSGSGLLASMDKRREQSVLSPWPPCRAEHRSLPEPAVGA